MGTILQGWKMREWKNRHYFAGVENAGVETSERSILMQNVMLGSAEKRMVRLISREIIFEEFHRCAVGLLPLLR